MMENSSTPPSFGVIILGGAHGTLALVRDFGRLGLPVAIVTNDHPLPRLSRYAQRQFEWSGPDAPDAAQWLAHLAYDYGMTGWLLLPSGDAEVKLIASQRDLLGRAFRLMSCDWDRLKLLCDKQLLPATAAGADVAMPRNYRIRSESDAASVNATFPVVIKPAMRTEQNAFTQAKAWRADSREELIVRYREAAALVGADNVVIQEFVPGGGEAQFSYAALWHRGAPVVEMTARRARQYPVEFSYTSTFVETAVNEAVRQASVRLLGSVGFEGLVEVEYKFDARDGTYKILDVNPRAWSWVGLCSASGLDLASAMVAIAHDQPVRPTQATAGHAWIHATRDVVSALQLIARGDLGLLDYIGSLKQQLTFSTFAPDDPWPGLCDIPLTIYRVIARRIPPPTKPPVRPADAAHNAR